ncbi:PASTA domain-containing protein [Leucobacter soli]|uniref:PASTA domain-containing protein n=1 Tax=Leucobacter soli TaxID=2812850 RepID=UPI003618CCED
MILHALAKDRARRFQSASEFRDALRLAAGGVMPQLGAESEQTNVLFTAGDEGASESELALRRLSESGGATRSQSRPPVMWVWASILTVMAVIVAVVIWLMLLAPKTFTPSNTREVPALVNTEEAAALAALDELDLTGVVETEENDEIAEGLVIRTDPEAGARITTDMQVTLYVSSGPSGVEVPEFSLMSLKQYTAALEELGLEVGSVSKRNDPVEKKNAVLSVSPEVGTILDRGEAVELVVASGKVKIPDVTGQTVEAATQLLQPLRLAVNVVPDPNCPAAGATIIRQSLVGEQKRGSTVDIFYCSGLSGEED